LQHVILYYILYLYYIYLQYILYYIDLQYSFKMDINYNLDNSKFIYYAAAKGSTWRVISFQYYLWFETWFDLIGQLIVGHDIKTEFTHRRVCARRRLRKGNTMRGGNSTFENYSWLARIVYSNCLRVRLVRVYASAYVCMRSTFFFAINHVESRKYTRKHCKT